MTLLGDIPDMCPNLHFYGCTLKALTHESVCHDPRKPNPGTIACTPPFTVLLSRFFLPSTEFSNAKKLMLTRLLRWGVDKVILDETWARLEARLNGDEANLKAFGDAWDIFDSMITNNIQVCDKTGLSLMNSQNELLREAMARDHFNNVFYSPSNSDR
jgi:hypothetical protein